MIRKLSLGLAVLLSGFTANTLAKSSIDVSVPCYNGGFTFGLAGLYLRPSSASLDYTLVTNNNVVVTQNAISFEGILSNAHPDYDWGYSLNLGAFIPGTGNDVTLAYSDYNHSFNDTTRVKGQTADSYVETQARTKFNYQVLNLDLGQHVNFGCQSHFRFSTGLRLAELKTGFSVFNKEGSGNQDSTQFQTNQYTKFRGAGPEVSTEMEYSLGSGFGIVGELGGSLLVGNFKNSLNTHSVDFTLNPSSPDVTSSTITIPSQTRVVPNLNAKLGLAYNYQFCNASHSKLTVEGGYRADHYFDVADRFSVIDGFGLNSTRSVSTSLSGPYVGVQVHL